MIIQISYNLCFPYKNLPPMKKFFTFLLTLFLLPNSGKSQVSLLYKLDDDRTFNSIVLGTLKTNFINQIEGEQSVERTGNKEYMYVGENKDYYNPFGIQFGLLVLEFDKQNRLVRYKLSQRYSKDQESQFSSEYNSLRNKFESIYGQQNTIQNSTSGSQIGIGWTAEDVELGLFNFDVEPLGTKQITISVLSLKLEIENKIKNLKQNVSVIDNISGFENYKFGKTMQDYNCDSWLCQKKPQNYSVGNNIVESINLNFSANTLYAIVIIFKTGDQILETLTKKYGTPLKETVNEMAFNKVEKYFWRGEIVGIQFYLDNGKYYLNYSKITKKSLNEL